MVTITGSTLRANVYEHIYDTLTSASLLSSTANVVAAYKDTMTSFPYVVVNPISVSKDNPTFDRSSFDNQIVVLIDIFTKKNKDIDQITDQIDNLSALKSVSGLSLVSWDESVDFTPQNENKIHRKTITLGYKRR